MALKKGYNTEAIIRKLRQAEVVLHEEKSIAEACRSLGISDATYYKWRKNMRDAGLSSETVERT
jgi:putative transposase